jgi:hypothetical protein
MRLIDELERLVAAEASLFRAQLLREDLARLRRLQALAASHDAAGFRKAGIRVGWTQGDARTHELAEPLGRLLDALHAYEHGNRDAAQEAHVVACWEAVHRARMERLVGCLSTPVPKPLD